MSIEDVVTKRYDVECFCVEALDTVDVVVERASVDVNVWCPARVQGGHYASRVIGTDTIPSTAPEAEDHRDDAPLHDQPVVSERQRPLDPTASYWPRTCAACDYEFTDKDYWGCQHFRQRKGPDGTVYNWNRDLPIGAIGRYSSGAIFVVIPSLFRRQGAEWLDLSGIRPDDVDDRFVLFGTPPDITMYQMYSPGPGHFNGRIVAGRLQGLLIPQLPVARHVIHRQVCSGCRQALDGSGCSFGAMGDLFCAACNSIADRARHNVTQT